MGRTYFYEVMCKRSARAVTGRSTSNPGFRPCYLECPHHVSIGVCDIGKGEKAPPKVRI